MSTSKTKCKLNSSNDLKTYQRSLQPITKFFGASSRSDEKSTFKLKDSPGLLGGTSGTLILQESPPDSSPNNSGVFQVTAKPTIDISKRSSDLCLMNDHLQCPDLRPPKPEDQFSEKALNNVCKRINNKSSKGPPTKKKKDDKEETQLQDKANTSAQPPAGKTEFLFEFSEDEDEKKDRLVNGDANSSEVYFCKHCDYSDVNIKHVSAHYQNDHPYIRYNAVYIQDPCDWSATFRCLQCPVEFSSVADLKRHYTENHPEGPDIFTMHSGDLCLVFKCFVCPFTTGAVKELKDHYKERHPTHEVDNSLTYCRYSVNRCQEGPPQLDKFEKAPGPEKPQLISHDSAHTSPEEVKNAPSPQHATSKRADVSVYRCKRCNFCHKSVVVMHVHYQKSHPDEVVTIDKIKQSGCVTSPTALQMTAEKSPKAVPIKAKSTSQKNISDSSKETGNKAEEIPLSLANPTHMPEASKTHSASAQSDKLKSAEDRSKVKKSPTKRKREMFPGMDGLSSDSPNELFYCQFCSFSGTKVKSVVGHHNAKHATDAPINTEEVLAYSFEMRKKILQSETEASTRTTTSVSKNRKVEVYDKNKRKEEVGAADALVAAYNPYACAEKLYYCQKCNYGNPSPQGVVNHQVKVHHNIRPNLKHVFEHTALIRDEMEKSKAKDSSFSSRLPLPLMVEGEEDVFFCHFCNYRHRNLKKVLWHYVQKHNGFVVKSEEIQRYTSVVLKETKKSQLKTTGKEVSRAFVGNNEIPKKKTKKLGKVSASPSIRALQTQRTLPCHRCPYSTQYVYMLRRHMWNIHKSNRSSAEVLRACFKRGNLETGYYCDLCVFSHSKAIAVYEHYQEQHPGRRLSLEYVSTRLYVGPKQTKPQTKQPDGTDSCSSTQRSEQSENKKYSCRACSYKGSSLSSITRHYRAFHPWSVKEDGSVLYLINNKKRNANRQVEDPNEMPQSFDTYQVPLEFEKSLDSSPQAASSQQLKCPFCPAMFCTKRGYKTHCGMKHQGAENLDKEKEEQVQTQPRVHVFKCRHCTYVNTSYQGVLTHCQMRHPALESLADSLHVEASVDNWEDCVKRKGPGLRLSGYMCKSCPQIYKTQEKLSKHCEEDHDESVANMLPKKSKSAPELSAVSKTKHHKIHNQGSVSKASFLNRNRHAVIRCQYCSYSCSTKFVLARHLQVRHKTSSVSKARDCFYKCLLCSKLYFKKKRLGHHYANKHGKDAFLKYYAPFYKEVHKKPAEAVPDSPLNQHNIPEACESSTTAEENKKLVFKCPKCPYVNSSYHGTLTHCQMKHPELTARADELQTLEIFVSNMVRCTLGKASNVRGYMCKRCPQIHVSLKKLKIHCERDHNQAKKRDASKHSVECETEQRPETGFQGSILEAFTLKIKTSSTGTTEIGSSQQLDTHESLPSNSLLLQDKKSVYKCHVCTYAGSCRKYLYCHYKNTHKLDAYTTYKLLEKYNKYKHKSRNVAETKSKDIAHAKCKLCPNLTFNSSQQLISHYSTLHLSDSILNFTVLNQASKRTTGLYRCSLCKKQMNGTRILCYHLDRHRDKEKNSAKTARASDKVITPPTKSVALGEQDELPMLETVEDLAQWNVTPVETFTVPPSSPLSPPNPSDPEQPELESKEDKLACKQCGRTFMSLKGLRSHERSHATLAAIKKQSTLSTSALKHDINKYVLYKDGNLRPFLCSICSYRTTVLSLWKSHFMKKHRDVVMDRAETDGQDEESAHMANEERPNSSDELNNLPELDNEPKNTEESLYLEPPDVQRQLNHYSLMAQASTISKTNVEEAKLPDNSLLPCEFCNFNTGHLSSVRRHYLNRHGKKMLRCKDCNFFTGIRKTLEMHIDKGHSTCQSEPTHQKDLRCPFCLYQTKNKNNMIDHVVLHREERVVPIEVRRPKLSRYLQDLVFRCHKCTFTSGSAEMLRLHMMKHDDIKPYKCRLCYFDCPQLKDLEAHLNDKHQVMRNHELVGQVSLHQLEASVCRMPEEEAEHLSDMEHQNDDSEDIKTEEFDTRCNEVLNETQAKNPPENNIGENTLMPKEGFQSKGQDGKNGKREREECQAECSVLDIQYEDKKTITTDQDKQDTQERETVLFSQYEDYNFPEKYGQTNKNQTKLRVGEDTSVTFTQLKQRSTTSGNTLEEAQVHKLDFRGQKHRMMNVEDKIEDDILRHVLQLDEDGNNYKLHKKLHWDKTVKMEQNIEPEVTDNVLNGNVLYNEQGSITVANSQQIQAPTNAISTSAKMNYSEANRVRAHEPLTFERNLLTLGPNFGQLKIGHKGILGVSFRKGKEKQIQTQNNSTEVRDTYGEMPVLEKERLKEEMHPFSWCKEEDWSNQSDQKEDKKEEMVSEDVKTEEGDGIENARSLHVPEGAVSNGETTQEKMFTCEFCGRILMNSSELEHHIIRHGI